MKTRTEEKPNRKISRRAYVVMQAPNTGISAVRDRPENVHPSLRSRRQRELELFGGLLFEESGSLRGVLEGLGELRLLKVGNTLCGAATLKRRNLEYA